MQNIINIEEQVKLLVELQGLDSQIFKLRRDLESMPEEIRRLEEAYKEKTAEMKRMEEELKSFQLKRKEKEMDLESKEGAIKKYQTQLYQVKTNKEYTALDHEIARMKADNSLIEEDIIKILDQIELQNKKTAQEKECLKTEEAKVNDEKKKRLEESKVIEGELAELWAQRALLVPKVDKKILPKYERLINNKDGLAVVPVASDSCQGCFRIMPPQVINEIRMKAELVFCENCTRILYIEE